MAIQLGLEVRWEPRPSSRTIHISSSTEERPADLPCGLDQRDVAHLEPRWARYPAGVATLLGVSQGGTATIASSLPPSAGLSSSAALCVAFSLVWGAASGAAHHVLDDPIALARLCQSAEALAGSRVGLMDPLVSVLGVAGQAVLIDFATLQWSMITLPAEAAVVVVHSGEDRELASTKYNERREECTAAERVLGPLHEADETSLHLLGSTLLRRRARHVISECRRVLEFARALEASDLDAAGVLMNESHRSLALDFEVSTPGVDALVEDLQGRPGIYGARLTGGGFGGCVVALCSDHALTAPGPRSWPAPMWHVHAAEGASLSVTQGAGQPAAIPARGHRAPRGPCPR